MAAGLWITAKIVSQKSKHVKVVIRIFVVNAVQSMNVTAVVCRSTAKTVPQNVIIVRDATRETAVYVSITTRLMTYLSAMIVGKHFAPNAGSWNAAKMNGRRVARVVSNCLQRKMIR